MPQVERSVDLKTAIIRALEDDRYDWRTIPGIARSVGTTEPEVERAIESLTDVMVRATADDGRTLFTTRKHYEKTHGLRDRLLSALADKVVA